MDFSFDLQYLQKSIRESHQTLKSVVLRHLTEKSINRIDEVFTFFNNRDFLESIFRKDNQYTEVMNKIIEDINKAMDSGDI